MRVALDASDFVSAYLAVDVRHAISMKLLGALIEKKRARPQRPSPGPRRSRSRPGAKYARDGARPNGRRDDQANASAAVLSSPLSAWEEGR
jgi:hypothetical protein